MDLELRGLNYKMDDLSKNLEDIFSFSPPLSSTNIEKIEGISKTITIIESNKSEIKTLKDEEFIRTFIKEMLVMGKDVLQSLKDEIRIGTPATKSTSFSEVYASMTSSIERLMILDRTAFDIEAQQNPITPIQAPVVNNNLIMDSKAMLALIREGTKLAKQDSEMNDISTEFEEVKE